MVVSSEILFANVRNQLHVAPKTMNCSFNGVKRYVFNVKLADLLLNQCSLAVRRTLIQADFVSLLIHFLMLCHNQQSNFNNVYNRHKKCLCNLTTFREKTCQSFLCLCVPLQSIIKINDNTGQPTIKLIIHCFLTFNNMGFSVIGQE